jgi:hypothetical protein
LGELLAGDRKKRTNYQINFKSNTEYQNLCSVHLKDEDVEAFRNAVDNEYYFEMFLDGLPIWGYIGDLDDSSDLLMNLGAEEPKRFIFTHMHFSISYNDDRVIGVNISQPAKANHIKYLDNMEDRSVTFSYSVEWKKTNVPFENRMDEYAQTHFLPTSFEIHWLSIINSFVLVILLTAFLGIILMRVLKNDFTKYLRKDEENDMGLEDSGWKLIHQDVFRPPSNVLLFSSLIGMGAQLFVMTFLLLSLALLGLFAPTKRGSVATASIILYALTSGVGGYVSARLYKQLGGTQWVWNTIVTALSFPLPLTVTFGFLNTTAIVHGSTAALPFGTIMVVIALYLLVSFPLTLIGSIAGRNTASNDLDAPCRVNKVARQIPDPSSIFMNPSLHLLVAGFLPFSAIYIELHYIFAAVWGHKIYTLFGILFLATVMLVIVTSFITIALVYFRLAGENYHWWWSSFYCGGSTGIFIYGYCFYYYYHRSEMNGFMQTSFFFGYMAMVSYAFMLMLGFVGFYSSLFFVRHIYDVIKSD